MTNPRRSLARFFLKHRDKGIPNLMLYIVLGSGLMYLLNLVNGGVVLYDLLVFDKTKILQGELWRLVTWLFTNIMSSNPLLNILFLYFFYRLGNTVERTVGTFKFNLFYLSGVILMDVFAMIFCPTEPVLLGNTWYAPEAFADLYTTMPFYLHLALVLAFATSYPESRFYLFMIIPIPAWVMALVYLAMVGTSVFNMIYPLNLLPHALFPLIGLLNYFLFFGKQIPNLIPHANRQRKRPERTCAPRKSASRNRGKTIPFPDGNSRRTVVEQAEYTHRCSVCGRTDVSHPELEFRYCSRCQGYHCYCQDHIGNHEHKTQ